MKAKRILTLLLSSVLLLTCLTACGNKQPQIINPNGEVDVSEEPNRTPQKEEHMPVYDYKNLPASNFLEGKEIEISYYASKLNDRNMISYNEIYDREETKDSYGNMNSYTKWNDIYDRYDKYDSYGNKVGSYEYNDIYERWEYDDY